MNNKGFTLTEVLAVLIIISIALLVAANEIGKTLSITKTESYNLMKENIVKASETYIKECQSKVIDCNLNWQNNKTSFKARVLKENGYYINLNSPIDNKELDYCLNINAKKSNGIIEIKIIDECY